MATHQSTRNVPLAPMSTTLTNGRPSSADGLKTLWQHEAEHLSTLVTSANRPPPDPDSSLRRLHQLADNRQLTITPVNLVLQEYNFKRELLVTNVDTGVSLCAHFVNLFLPGQYIKFINHNY